MVSKSISIQYLISVLYNSIQAGKDYLHFNNKESLHFGK